MLKELKNSIKGFIKNQLGIKGYNFTFPSQFHQKTYSFVHPYTMTSPERVCALIDAVQYICHNSLEGVLWNVAYGAEEALWR